MEQMKEQSPPTARYWLNDKSEFQWEVIAPGGYVERYIPRHEDANRAEAQAVVDGLNAGLAAMHTAGPLDIDIAQTGPTTYVEGVGFAGGEDHPFTVIGQGTETVAVVPQQEGASDGGHGNAERLVLAWNVHDPLLAACKALISATSDCGYDCRQTAVAGAVELARAAVAKAEGRAP